MKARTLGALGLVLAAAGACFGQLDPGKLRFNGVGLGSTYGQVKKALGKPSKETKPRREECTGGQERNVYYDGASLFFMDQGSKNFDLVAFEVTSPKYSISGIKVGDTQLTVRRVLGSKFNAETNQAAGTTTWTFEMDGETGSTTVTFRKGKVIKIESAFLMC